MKNDDFIEVRTKVNKEMFGYLFHIAKHKFNGNMDALLRFALTMWLGDIFLLGMRKVEKEIEEEKNLKSLWSNGND